MSIGGMFGQSGGLERTLYFQQTYSGTMTGSAPSAGATSATVNLRLEEGAIVTSLPVGRSVLMETKVTSLGITCSVGTSTNFRGAVNVWVDGKLRSAVSAFNDTRSDFGAFMTNKAYFSQSSSSSFYVPTTFDTLTAEGDQSITCQLLWLGNTLASNIPTLSGSSSAGIYSGYSDALTQKMVYPTGSLNISGNEGIPVTLSIIMAPHIAQAPNSSGAGTLTPGFDAYAPRISISLTNSFYYL